MPARPPLTLPQRMMLLSIAAALVTITIKTLAWWLTGSVGLFSDAAESAVNLLAAAFAFTALRIAARPADAGHPYGHGKVEYFASGLEGALILVAAIAIGYTAIERLLNPVELEGLGLGLALSLVASAINGGVAWALLRVGRREDSLVLQADGHHLLTDVWTSVGVVLALALVFVFPSAPWLDPVVAIAVALNILRVAWRLLAASIQGLMDAALPQREQQLIASVLSTSLALAPFPTSVQRLRWRRAGSHRFLAFHLNVPGEVTVETAHALCDRLEAAVRAHLPRIEIDIHVEPLPMAASTIAPDQRTSQSPATDGEAAPSATTQH